MVIMTLALFRMENGNYGIAFFFRSSIQLLLTLQVQKELTDIHEIKLIGIFLYVEYFGRKNCAFMGRT